MENTQSTDAAQTEEVIINLDQINGNQPYIFATTGFTETKSEFIPKPYIRRAINKN